VAQDVLDMERRASRGICISITSGHHTQGPIIFSVLIRGAIDCDALNVQAARLFPDFCQRPPPQIRHRK
jgi:hypothetical protein